MPPGIIVTESAISTGTVTSQGINRFYLFGVSTNVTPADINTPIFVTNLTEFNTRFPGALEITTLSIAFFFANYPQGQLFFINCKDPAIAAPATTLDRQNYIFALSQIAARGQNLELGIISIPETVNLVNQADRTAVYASAEALCQRLDWLHFVNSATTTDNKAKVLAERNLYSSPLGHSAYYYGFIRDANTKNIPVSVAAVAIALRRSREEAPFEPPAGANYPLQGVSSIVNYVDNDADYDELKLRGINVIQQIPRVGWCLWGARTLAIEPKFQFINTRMAVSVATFELQIAVTPFLFRAIDPRGSVTLAIDNTIVSVMSSLFNRGGLSGEEITKSFRIVDRPVTDGNLRRILKRVLARYVDTLEEISIDVINVDVIS